MVKIVLTLIPFIWIIGCVPFINQVKPLVLGLPLLAFWPVAGIPVTFICLYLLYGIVQKEEHDDKEAGGTK